MKNIFKIAFVIIGALIGAGFASGKEIYIFFFSHGVEGIYGILISGVLIGIIIYKTLNLINKNNIKTYKEFLDNIIKRDKIDITMIVDIVVNIFILITFFIMIAGFGAYFEQQFGINNIIGSTILSILCFVIFMTNVNGVVKVSELLIPILIISLTIIGIYNIKDLDYLNIQNYLNKVNESNFIIDAVLYSSYNSILLIPVLITLRNYLKDNKQIIGITIFTVIVTIILSIIVFLMLIKIDVDIKMLEMPVIYVISHMFKIIKYIYGFIILSSIFTTAISLGISFLQNINKKKKSYTHIAIVMCITSVITSKIGFSNLVNLLYPIFGYLGMGLGVQLLLRKRERL